MSPAGCTWALAARGASACATGAEHETNGRDAPPTRRGTGARPVLPRVQPSTLRQRGRSSITPMQPSLPQGPLPPALPHGASSPLCSPGIPKMPGYPPPQGGCSTQQYLLLQQLILAPCSQEQAPEPEGCAGWMLGGGEGHEAAPSSRRHPGPARWQGSGIACPPPQPGLCPQLAPPLEIFAPGSALLPASAPPAIFQATALERDQGGCVGWAVPSAGHGAVLAGHGGVGPGQRGTHGCLHRARTLAAGAFPMLSAPKNWLWAATSTRPRATPARSIGHLKAI